MNTYVAIPSLQQLHFASDLTKGCSHKMSDIRFERLVTHSSEAELHRPYKSTRLVE
jgi:hypothetical protein